MPTIPYAFDQAYVEASTLASIRRHVAWAELGTLITFQLDQIHAFLSERSIPHRGGHNVCMYHLPGKDGVELEVGVQVAARFAGSGGIICSSTPSGEVAHTLHLGAYDALGKAHEALMAYCREQGLDTTELGWEVYGDWEDDPSKRRTDVYRLLAPLRAA